MLQIVPDDGGSGDARALETPPGRAADVPPSNAHLRSLRGRYPLLPEQAAQGPQSAALSQQSLSSGTCPN